MKDKHDSVTGEIFPLPPRRGRPPLPPGQRKADSRRSLEYQARRRASEAAVRAALAEVCGHLSPSAREKLGRMAREGRAVPDDAYVDIDIPLGLLRRAAELVGVDLFAPARGTVAGVDADD